MNVMDCILEQWEMKKRVIDYCLLNENMKLFITMNIDENIEQIDLSDHNLIKIKFNVITNNEE